ncbi:hypothetical protein M3484_05825 [Pseudomonas sp. GX19020]|uniref:hypothetical protein n=1 Tax=Pseudomonas sp. GX19020 TaxID=2942277 RepID=UPI002019166F|nr:hypothetical protein [Pseudomonas sp. GX19020]MCL4066082.1 hypothetical protein [Pseudomonas sp. GX19020]
MCFENVAGEKVAHESEKFTRVKARGSLDGAIATAIAVGRIIVNEVTVHPAKRAVSPFSDPAGAPKASHIRDQAPVGFASELVQPWLHDFAKAKGRPEGRPFCAGIPVSYWCR